MFKCTIHRNGWQQSLRHRGHGVRHPWGETGWAEISIWKSGGKGPTRWLTRRKDFLRLVLGAGTDSRPWGYGCEGMWGGTSSVLLLLKQNWHARPRLGERWTVELKAFFQRRTTAFKFNNICKSQTITLYLWEWNANIILTKIVYLSFHLSICNE